MQDALVQAVFTGHPKTLSDAQGTWSSSIVRDRAHGAVPVSLHGLAGDKVTQPYHGGLDAALCVHLTQHYEFWNSHYAMDLRSGSVGENLTIGQLIDDDVCVGDHIRVGTAIVQVSGPRVPCATLARRIGRPDWVKLTIRENRTGFYLRVLQPGAIAEGDRWSLQERINPNGSIPAINQCMYLNFDPDYARAMLTMSGLTDWWKEQARQKLDHQREHWTSTINV